MKNYGAVALLLVSLSLLEGCARSPLPVLGQIPEFELTDQRGQKFQRSSLDGHVWVADFIYTNCEGPCPRMSSRMHQIQKVTNSAVRLVSFSVDPARDTPSALEEYGRKYSADAARWRFLTGSSETLNMLDHDAFKLGSLGAEMDHSTRFVLIDQKGRIRGYYGLAEGDPVARISKDAARLEAEPT
jgi:cytochrome oxidase Cu insertion factor (SCO1/SenC/PrrC family)